MIHKEAALERSVKIFLLDGLNKFYGTNLTLISKSARPVYNQLHLNLI